jgi:hypothetical protein
MLELRISFGLLITESGRIADTLAGPSRAAKGSAVGALARPTFYCECRSEPTRQAARSSNSDKYSASSYRCTLKQPAKIILRLLTTGAISVSIPEATRQIRKAKCLDGNA